MRPYCTFTMQRTGAVCEVRLFCRSCFPKYQVNFIYTDYIQVQYIQVQYISSQYSADSEAVALWLQVKSEKKSFQTNYLCTIKYISPTYAAEPGELLSCFRIYPKLELRYLPHLSKPLLSPQRYGLKYAKLQPEAITCQCYKCPDVST